MARHSPVIQILFHIESRTSNVTSPPAALLVECGGALHLVSVGSQALLVPNGSHNCKALSTTVSFYYGLLL